MVEDTIGDDDEEADTFFKDDLGIAINDNDDVEEDFISNDDRENWSRVGRTSLLIPTWSPS